MVVIDRKRWSPSIGNPGRHAPERATTDHILPDLEGRTFKAHLAPVVAADAVPVTDGRTAYGQFAGAAGIPHITCVASAGERLLGSYHVQNVNFYQSRLKGWMVPFEGVASWYLPSYLGWRRVSERDAQCLTRRHIKSKQSQHDNNRNRNSKNRQPPSG